MNGSTKRVLVSDRIKNGAHPTRRPNTAAGCASRDNERIENYSPTDNPQLTEKIPTEWHNVGAVDQRISLRDRIEPVGMARGRRGNVHAKCEPRPTTNDPQKEA
ncbi:unnamed protein product [Echinostoma caproni]|uniref:Uncharacterized protein n=1 Tax=Echinostoma caproni TaxID=27848 RepID=A0A183AEV2_9TREM|nr:unnamed protein product [Echinostoma caproni]